MQLKQLHNQNPLIQANSLKLHIEDCSVQTKVTMYRPAINSLDSVCLFSQIGPKIECLS